LRPLFEVFLDFRKKYKVYWEGIREAFTHHYPLEIAGMRESARRFLAWLSQHKMGDIAEHGGKEGLDPFDWDVFHNLDLALREHEATHKTADYMQERDFEPPTNGKELALIGDHYLRNPLAQATWLIFERENLIDPLLAKLNESRRDTPFPRVDGEAVRQRIERIIAE
jgi:hypothetical protein